MPACQEDTTWQSIITISPIRPGISSVICSRRVKHKSHSDFSKKRKSQYSQNIINAPKWVSVSWQHENLVNVTLKTFFFYSHSHCMQTSLQSAQCFADQSVKQYKSGSFVKITSRVILFSDLTFRQWLYTNKYDNKNNVAIDSFKQITQYKECNGASKGHSTQVSAGLRMNDLLSLEMTECPIFGMTSIPWTNLMTGLQWKWNRSFKNTAESMFNVASTWSSSWK